MKYLSDKDTWRKGGIYKITSPLSLKSYFGQTICFRNRFYQHKNLLKLGKNPSVLLQKFTDKYGLENINFQVVETCEKEKLNEREFYYLNNEKCDLNLSKNPEKIRYGIKHTNESKIKMVKTRLMNGSYKNTGQISIKTHTGNKYNLGKTHSKETKIKIGEKSKGRKWSDESKKKHSERLKGRKKSDQFKNDVSNRMIGNKNALGVVFTESRKQKIREAVSKKVIMISLEDQEIKQFNSTKEAGKYLGTDNYKNISAVCRGERKTALGFKWRYNE
jgi:group I intron endonuclease